MSRGGGGHPGWRGPSQGTMSKKNKILNAASSQNEDNPDVKIGIRELLLRLEPLVKVSGGNAPFESMIGFLEEMDDSSFDRYLLVRHIKSKLHSSLYDLVQSEVQLQCRDTQLTPEKMKMVAPAILSKLMTSNEMEEVLGSLEDDIGDAANDMCTNFDRELVLMSQLRSQDGQRPQSRNSSSLSDSLSSTWNQTGFIFIQPNQYMKLAEKLNPYRPSDERIEALNTLLISQVSECVSIHCWPNIREGLQSAVLDPNPGIASLALRLYAKMLANVTPFCTKEAFVSLAHAILSLYKDRTRNYQLPTLSTEISFKKRPNNNLLQVAKLITSTCKELPRCWSRYPLNIIEEIMTAMLDLISTKTKGQKIVSPLHLVSLVDPKAGWLKAWLHGNLGRQMFFALVQDYNILKFNALQVLVTLEKDTFPLLSRSSGRKKGLLSSSLVSFAYFSHNLNSTCLVLQYQNGQKLLGGHMLIKNLLKFVADAQIASHQTASRLITKALIKTFSFAEANINKFLLDEELWMGLLIEPLINFQYPQKVANLLKILGVLLKTKKGQKFAGKIKVKQGNLTDFMFEFATNLLKSLVNLSHQHEQVLVIALSSIKSLCSSHVCAMSEAFQEFIEALVEAFIDLDELSLMTPTNSMANVALESHSTELKRLFLEVFDEVSKTPLGLHLMAKIDENMIEHLVKELSRNFPLYKFCGNGNLSVTEKAIMYQHMELTGLLDEPDYLQILMLLIGDLDVRNRLLIELDLKNYLEEELEKCKSDEGILVIDQESQGLFYLSETLKNIGGPTERKKVLVHSLKMVQEISEAENNDHPDLIKFLNDEKNEIKSPKWIEESRKRTWKYPNMNLQTAAELIYQSCIDTIDPIKEKKELDKTDHLAIETMQKYATMQNTTDVQELSNITDPERLWISTILGILFKGNQMKTNVVLNKFKVLDEDFLVDIGHKTELILNEELPKILPKLRSMNFNVTWIVSQWYTQYFLNILDWKDIVLYILLLVQNGPDFAIYVFVALFKHFKEKILKDDEGQDGEENHLGLVLKSDPIDFNLCNYLPYIHQLSNKHKF